LRRFPLHCRRRCLRPRSSCGCCKCRHHRHRCRPVRWAAHTSLSWPARGRDVACGSVGCEVSDCATCSSAGVHPVVVRTAPAPVKPNHFRNVLREYPIIILTVSQRRIEQLACSNKCQYSVGIAPEMIVKGQRRWRRWLLYVALAHISRSDSCRSLASSSARSFGSPLTDEKLFEKPRLLLRHLTRLLRAAIVGGGPCEPVSRVHR